MFSMLYCFLVCLYFIDMASMGYMYVIFTLFIHSYCSSTYFNKNPTNRNHGVHFRAFAILDNSDANYVHLYKIKIMQMPDPPPKLQNPCKNMMQNYLLRILLKYDLCSLYEDVILTFNKQANLLYTDIQHNMDAIHSYSNNMQLNSTNRVKRGLVNIAGETMKFLFGLATNSDYENLLHIINKIENQNNRIAEIKNDAKQDLLSFITLQNKQNKDTLDKIKSNYDNVHALNQRINWLTSTLNNYTQEDITLHNIMNHFMHTVILLLHQRVTELQYLQTSSIELLQAIQLLQDNKLSPRLITHQQLQNLYGRITQKLRTAYPHLSITDPSVQAIYDRPTILHYISQTHIYIKLTIPLSSYDSIFTLYQVISLPLPISHNVTTVTTQIINLPQYVAISKQNKYYMQLNQEELQICHGDHIIHCPANLPIYPYKHTSCILALWVDDSILINSLCKSVSTFNVQIRPQIISLNPTSNQYYIINYNNTQEINWDLECINYRNRDRTIIACNWCIVNIPCGCTLITKTFQIKALTTSCLELESQSQIVTNFPINLYFLYAYQYNQSILNNVTGTSLFNTLPYIQLPPKLQQLINTPHFNQYQKQIQVETETLINKLKQNDVIYLDPVTTMIDQLQLSLSDWPIWINWVYIALHVLLIIVCLVVIALIIKIRNLSHLVFLLTIANSTSLRPVPQIEAFSISHHTVQQDNKVEINYIQFPQKEFYILSTLILMLLVLLGLLVIKQLYEHRIYLCAPFKYFKNNKCQTEILLELYSPTNSVVVPIVSLDCHRSQVKIDDFEISIKSFVGHCFSKFLQVDWHNTKLSIINRFNNIQLNQLIPVPFHIAHHTRKIIMDNKFKINILLGNKGRYFQYELLQNNLSKLQSTQFNDHE